MRGFNAFTFLSASVSLTKDDVLQKLVVINANNASIACSLPDLPGADAGVRVSIMAYNATKQVTVGSSSQNIIMSSVLKRFLYLGDGDMIDLAMFLGLVSDPPAADVVSVLPSPLGSITSRSFALSLRPFLSSGVTLCE